jgi:hypothetical protein
VDSRHAPGVGTQPSRAVVIQHAAGGVAHGGYSSLPRTDIVVPGASYEAAISAIGVPRCPEARGAALTTAIGSLDLMASLTGGRSAASSPERLVLARWPPSASMAYEPSRNQKDWIRRRQDRSTKVSPMFPVNFVTYVPGCTHSGATTSRRATGVSPPPVFPVAPPKADAPDVVDSDRIRVYASPFASRLANGYFRS